MRKHVCVTVYIMPHSLQPVSWCPWLNKGWNCRQRQKKIPLNTEWLIEKWKLSRWYERAQGRHANVLQWHFSERSCRGWQAPRRACSGVSGVSCLDQTHACGKKKKLHSLSETDAVWMWAALLNWNSLGLFGVCIKHDNTQARTHSLSNVLVNNVELEASRARWTAIWHQPPSPEGGKEGEEWCRRRHIYVLKTSFQPQFYCIEANIKLVWIHVTYVL